MSPFEPKRGDRDLPTSAYLTDPKRVWDADVIEEHFAETAAARHLPQRSNGDAWRLHRQKEGRHTVVLDDVGIAACDELAPVRELRSGAPHLLPFDHPLVALAYGSGAQTGEIG